MSRSLLSALSLSLVLSVQTGAQAQSIPVSPQANPPQRPTGPADIMNQANAGRARTEAEQAVRAGDSVAAQKAAADPHVTQGETTDPQAAGHGAAGAGGAADPHAGGADPHAAGAAPHGAAAGAPHGGMDASKVLAEPTLPQAEPKSGLAPGSIEIEVVDQNGAAQAGADIVLGVMASMGGRTEKRAKTDASGHYTFSGLATGTQQAYRVNIVREGAKFSTTPFRLPDEMGYVARMPLRGVTSDPKMMFQVIGQTVVELRDDRLHITQQARVANAGENVITFPKDGLVVPLPEGYTAFTWQEQMSDQKGEELAGKGFRIKGSLPPGSATLAWTFDLKRDGESAKIIIDQPWRTYSYRVISEAPVGLKLRVTDFPEPERVQDNNRDLLFTQIQRAPSEAKVAGFTIRIDGIPGPGPGRWIAVALAVLAVGIGLSRAFRRGDDRVERTEVLAQRKRELIELAKQADRERERGDIGPNYHAEKLDEIVTELALVLRDEEALAASGKPLVKSAPLAG